MRTQPSYAIHWLDHLIYKTYNPESPEFSGSISLSDAKAVSVNIEKEPPIILENMLSQIFASSNPVYLVEQYFRALRLLLSQLMSYNVEPAKINEALAGVYASLDKAISWLLNEMTLRFAEQVAANDEKTTTTANVLVNLSGDQVGMLLRAAKETKLLEARSFSALFRNIIPHISTPNSKTLSWEATRSQAYQVEERDKEVVIKVLHKWWKQYGNINQAADL